jgi:hypothetical protein
MFPARMPASKLECQVTLSLQDTARRLLFSIEVGIPAAASHLWP